MALGKDYQRQDCSLARALEVVGERWTLLVLRDCLFGVTRFSDLRGRLDIPRAVLADRLSALVAEGLLERRPYRPGRDEYLPTEQALALWPAIYALREWGERHYPPPGGRRRYFRHVPCDTDIDTTGRCPACGELPMPGELETRPGPGADLTLRDDVVSRALYSPHRMLTPLPPPSPAGTPLP
jgi:DNA-binding HxlR family transcriptional regulator